VEPVAVPGLEHDVLALGSLLLPFGHADQRAAEVGEPARERGDLLRALLQRDLARPGNLLAPFHGGSTQLHGAELAAAVGEGRLGSLDRPTAILELGGSAVELRLAAVEVGGVLAQERLELVLERADAALALVQLEVGPAQRRVVLVVAPGRRGMLGAARRSEERLQTVAASRVGVPPSRPLAPLPLGARLSLHPHPPLVIAPAALLSRRVRNGRRRVDAISRVYRRFLPQGIGQAPPEGGGPARPFCL
jgi:hypothetical protein